MNNKKSVQILFIVLSFVFILIKIFGFQIFIGFKSELINVAINTVGLLLVIFSIVFIIFRKSYNYIFIIINLIISLLLFTDTVYYKYFESVITITRITEAKTLGNIKESVFNLIKPLDFIYFADILIFILIIYKFKFNNIRLKTKSIIVSLVCITFGITLTGICVYSYNKYNDCTVNKDIIALNNLGVLQYHYYDLEQFLSDKFKKDKKIYTYNIDENQQDLNEGSYSKLINAGLTHDEALMFTQFFNQLNSERNKEDRIYKGAAKGKNVIMVQVEALQEFVIGKSIDGKEITPNLNNFIKESLYFNNIYDQTYMGTTSDSELLSNISLYPDTKQSVYQRYPNNEYHSLAKVLSLEGYNTYAFHGNDPNFWNRQEMYKNIGFDKFFSINELDNDEIIGIGLTDSSIYKQSMTKIDGTKPFYAFYVTLSSHHPYTYFTNYEFKDQFNASKFEGKHIGNYARSLHYADQAFGEFLDELKTQGIFNNSIIIVYGDHRGVDYSVKSDVEQLINKQLTELSWNTMRKVPLIIHFNGVSPSVIDKTAGQIDIMPTILNLLGVKCPYYAMGKDILNSEDAYALHTTGFIITDNYYYHWKDGKVYNIKDMSEIRDLRYKNEIQDIQKEIIISDLILKKNLLKLLYSIK